MAGVGVSVMAMVSTDWSYKLGWLFPLYKRFPRLLVEIPGTLTGRLGANEVGGALAFFLPFIASLALSSDGREDAHACSRASGVDHRSLIVVRWGMRLLLGLGAVFMALALLLTQSRSGMIGAAAGLLVLLVLKTRWALLLPPIVGWQAWRVIQTRGLVWLTDWWFSTTALRSYRGRVDVWLRGLYVVRNAPLTGVGLNTFTRVSHTRFPYFSLAADFPVTHAHNNLLQVGVDLGLPGLVCYLAVLGLFGWMAWSMYCRGEGLIRGVAAGSLSGMLAHQVFGLTDAVALGAKPGVFLWIMIGLVCGAFVNLRCRDLLTRVSESGIM